MVNILIWYLLISILGAVALPIAFRMLPGLTDRGYALSRILGLLLWGYLFWLMGSLGIIKNDTGGELLALLILVIGGGWVLKLVGWDEFKSWIQSQRKMIITVEIAFFLAFVGWAFVRSTNPEIVGTEKPMELAFLNAILRSPGIPPNDPWLSGYSISYYYFGYVLVVMLARLAGTPAGIAFNLGISLVFALAAIGSYSILYNLLSQSPVSTKKFNPRFAAFLGPFFILIVSNLGGFLHILRIFRVFWRLDQSGNYVSSFWTGLDMGHYAEPPTAEAFPHWWWWQASRIVQDFDFYGANKGDIIDEFPFFSFLLADLHPHVLAMPVAFLAISLALNLFLGGARGKMRWLWMKLKISPDAFALSSVVLGSLAFFNTWDFPFYVTLFAGAYILSDPPIAMSRERAFLKGSMVRVLGMVIRVGFALGVSGILLYLPFYFGFQSQAGGPLPNLIYITRGIYLWIHFIPLLIPIFGFLFYLWSSSKRERKVKEGLILALGMVVVLLALTLLLTLIITQLHWFDAINPEAGAAANTFLGSMAAPGWGPLIKLGFIRRLTIPGTLATIVLVISLSLAYLIPGLFKRGQEAESEPLSSQLPPNTFVLLLILVGGLLVLAPEFVFLRDLFGYRINTIFKFYFQVWLLWGLAAAYGVSTLWQRLEGFSKIAFRVVTIVVLALSLTYPIMGLWSRTNGFNPRDGFNLDGTAFLAMNNPDEVAAMIWLRGAPLGTVAEAVGGSYSQFARMASNSGQPTVLGWDFHEMQWRGGTKEMGSRKGDMERLYCTRDWEEALRILRQYEVRYVVVGPLEYSAYGAGSRACPSGMNEIKFSRFLPLAFEQGNTSIYLVPEEIAPR